MPAQIRPLSEQFFALWALVWLLIGMHSEMGHQVPRLSEDFVAVVVLANVQSFVGARFFVRVVNNLVLMPFQDLIVYHVPFGRASKIVSRTFSVVALTQEMLLLILFAKVKLAGSCMVLTPAH